MKVRSRPPLWRRLLRSAGFRAFHHAENNGDCRSPQNGEAWLIRQAVRCLRKTPEPLVVFDVGANVGDYARLVMDEARQVGCPTQLHAFEPSTLNTDILRRTFAKDPRVHVICAAVAENPGETILYTESAGSTHASLIKRSTFDRSAVQQSAVQAIRLDEYMASYNVGHIDILKLDIEGAEMQALRSLGNHLQPQLVELIQFEYGGTTLDARTTLGDFYELLGARGYHIAKLFPHALEIRSYEPWMDHYTYANYVAFSPHLMEDGRQVQ
jgi:FkbM family methyltransferase